MKWTKIVARPLDGGFVVTAFYDDGSKKRFSADSHSVMLRRIANAAGKSEEVATKRSISAVPRRTGRKEKGPAS